MIPWKKVCCAVDFADPCLAAIAQAVELARHFDSELTLVHVSVRPVPAASDVLVSSREVLRGEAARHEELFAAWRADVERRLGRPVRTRVLAGDPAAQVVRHAQDDRCDLIVMGTHGRTGIRRLVMGSVAERVARLAPCPVLIIRDEGGLEPEQDVPDPGASKARPEGAPHREERTRL
jgi:nucleotide-binding universal stress UspA family protein